MIRYGRLSADNRAFVKIDATSCLELGWIKVKGNTAQTISNYSWAWH